MNNKITYYYICLLQIYIIILKAFNFQITIENTITIENIQKKNIVKKNKLK